MMANKKGITCLFLGSGASNALADIALQKDFLKEILNKDHKGWIEESGVGKIKQTKFSDWLVSVNDIELCMSYLHNVAYTTPKKAKNGKQLSYKAAHINLRTAVVDYLEQKSELNKKSHSAKNTWRKFCSWLKCLQKRRQIVMLTTNYDLLIEIAIENLGNDKNKYYYPKINIANRAKKHKNAIRIYKLHGSINWMEKRHRGKQSNGKYDIKGNRYGRLKVDLHIDRKKIYPKPITKSKKSRIYYVFGNEKKFYTPIFIPFFIQKKQWLGERWGSIFKPHWQDAEKFLKNKIKEIYFIGYSLPTVDHNILQFLIDIFGRNSLRIKIVRNCKHKDKENLEKIFNLPAKDVTCGLENFLDKELKKCNATC